jgi:hypothetical protein
VSAFSQSNNYIVHQIQLHNTFLWYWTWVCFQSKICLNSCWNNKNNPSATSQRTEIWVFSLYEELSIFYSLSTLLISSVTYIYIFVCVFRRTNTIQVMWRLSSFTGEGRPRVSFMHLFQHERASRTTDQPAW